MKELTKEQALGKAQAYCSAAEHCRSEVAEKLYQWGVDSTASEEILRSLEEDDFLNDERYCRAFVHDKYRFAKWGKTKIAMALAAKRLPESSYRDCLEQIDETEYRDILRKLLRAKKRSLTDTDEYVLRGKLIRFALGKGYRLSDIEQCLDAD